MEASMAATVAARRPPRWETLELPGDVTLGARTYHAFADTLLLAEVADRPQIAGESRLVAGDELGVYRLVRRLGAGGQGEVFWARHTVLDDEVVIKVLHAHLSRDPGLVARLKGEGAAAHSVKHPGIVRIRDVQQAPDGRWYIVMELLEGETLAECLAKTVTELGPDGRMVDQAIQLPIAVAVDFALQIVRAVGAAHSRGIIHRDLKPENVMLVLNLSHGKPGHESEPRERVKVLDFGIAADAGGTSDDGAIMGSPWGMAPEQARCERTDARTDLYAIGAILYECLAGARPYRAASLAELLEQKVRGEAPIPIAHWRPGLPDPLVAFVMRAIAPAREGRPGNAAEFERELMAALGQEAQRSSPSPRPVSVRSRRRRLSWRVRQALQWVALVVFGTVAALAFQSDWWREGKELTRETRFGEQLSGLWGRARKAVNEALEGEREQGSDDTARPETVKPRPKRLRPRRKVPRPAKEPPGDTEE